MTTIIIALINNSNNCDQLHNLLHKEYRLLSRVQFVYLYNAERLILNTALPRSPSIHQH